MGDLLKIAGKLVGAIASRVKDVKTNHEGCRLLGNLAEQSLCIMSQLDGRQFESSTEKALELVNAALKEAHDAIDSCCNTNFITAMLYKQNLSGDLKHAAARLEHALSLISLSSIEMTSNTQEKLVELAIQLRNAKFEARAREAHLIKDLKEAFESAFYLHHKEREEIKSLVQQLVKEQASTHEELQKLLTMLREDSKEAKHNKERQVEFEIDEVIAVVVESLRNTKKLSLLTENMKKSLCCPITQDWMSDPVMIKESGMTYERASIEKWFNSAHCEDPLTNLKLKSTEYVANETLRNLYQSFFGESHGSPYAPLVLQTEKTPPRLEPGLYEGHGKFKMSLSTMLAFQLLVLEPSGDAFGYTMYKEENHVIKRNNVEIGKGEWTRYNFQLAFEDNCYFFYGKCDCEIDDESSKFSWKGRALQRGEKEEQNEFVFCHSPPQISRMIWPSQAMLQMDGEVITPGTQCKYKFKLLLSLMVDSNIDGWMWFGQACNKPKFIAYVTQGSWNSNGCLSFNVHCSPQGTLPNSQLNPTNWTSSFEIDGKIERPESGSLAIFVASITKKESGIMLEKDNLTLTPLDDLTSIECCNIRETSSWHLHSNGLQELQKEKKYKSECVEIMNHSKLSINYGLVPYHQRIWEQSPLHIAARNNAVDVVKELITEGAGIEDQDNDGETPLCLAAKSNAIDALNELIGKGANIECQDKDQWTPLHIASQNNHVDVVKELIANGANIECQKKDQWTPLHLASQNNHINVVKELIAKGANIECQTKQGSTPLHGASYNNHVNVVKVLIAKGANIECLAKNGGTPLHFASCKNRIDVVKELIAKGANIECQDKDQWTPLHLVSHNNHIDVVKELISKGANIECREKDGWTPLHLASRNNRIDVVKELIANGANIECQTISGFTPLRLALQNYHIDVVKELIANGAINKRS